MWFYLKVTYFGLNINQYQVTKYTIIKVRLSFQHKKITFYVGFHSFTIFLFYNKIVKLYMVDGNCRVIVGI
jgi:predicted MPP superfamily phosphohydrolase